MLRAGGADGCIGVAETDLAKGGGGVPLLAVLAAGENPAGEAVCARGGGGVAAGGGVSEPDFLLTHRFSTGSYTNEVSSPSFARIGPVVGEALPSRRKMRPNQDPEAGAVCLPTPHKSVVISGQGQNLHGLPASSFLGASAFLSVSADVFSALPLAEAVSLFLLALLLPRPSSSSSSSIMAGATSCCSLLG